MSKIVYLNHQEGGIETVSAALGDGRTLGLNSNQLDTIKKNVEEQVMNFNKPSIFTPPVTEPVMPTSEVAPRPIPAIEPVPEPKSVPFVAPVVPEPTTVSKPVVVPIVSPVTSEPTKVVTETTNNNVEIVSNNKKTDYDTLMECEPNIQNGNFDEMLKQKSKVMNFKEYKTFCEKWNLDIKYSNEKINYIVYVDTIG